MEKTASQIQKERIKELESKADALIAKCDVATLTSINEKGYPRTCVLSIDPCFTNWLQKRLTYGIISVSVIRD